VQHTCINRDTRKLEVALEQEERLSMMVTVSNCQLYNTAKKLTPLIVQKFIVRVANVVGMFCLAVT
jgi:hypothetical protein